MVNFPSPHSNFQLHSVKLTTSFNTFFTWLLGWPFFCSSYNICHFCCFPHWLLLFQILNVSLPQCSVPGYLPLAFYTPFPDEFIQLCGFISLWLPHLHLQSLFFFFLAMPPGLWDLSSLTRDRTQGSALEARSLNHWTAREVPTSPVVVPPLSFPTAYTMPLLSV